MNSLLSISAVSTESIPLIRELTYSVWPQTYRGLLSDEQIDYMLDLMYSETSLLKQINEGAQFLIVYDQHAPAGFASFEEVRPGNYKLHKIYILQSQQGKGTGRFLIEHITDLIKKAGGVALHLQVNKNNPAKSFYEKLGFAVIDQVKLDIGNGYFMDDYIMEKQIVGSL